MQLADGEADDGSGSVILSFLSHVQQVARASGTLHQQYARGIVVGIDARRSIAAPPAHHLAADLFVEVPCDFDHRRAPPRMPVETDRQEVPGVGFEGLPVWLRAPSLQIVFE